MFLPIEKFRLVEFIDGVVDSQKGEGRGDDNLRRKKNHTLKFLQNDGLKKNKFSTNFESKNAGLSSRIPHFSEF